MWGIAGWPKKASRGAGCVTGDVCSSCPLPRWHGVGDQGENKGNADLLVRDNKVWWHYDNRLCTKTAWHCALWFLAGLSKQPLSSTRCSRARCQDIQSTGPASCQVWGVMLTEPSLGANSPHHWLGAPGPYQGPYTGWAHYSKYFPFTVHLCNTGWCSSCKEMV